jgi:amidohydrolase
MMQKPNRSKDSIAKNVDSMRDLLISVSKFVHSHPEPNYKEFKSSSFLVETLKKFGLKVEYPYCGVETAFKATIGNAGEKPHVAVLAEFDALPVTMPDGTSPVVHACGHNLNCAAAIGAIAALKPIVGNLAGQISVVGTPAEEGGGGKIALLKAGGFQGVDAILTVHGDQRNWYTVARSCSASDFLRVTFLGHPASLGYTRNYVNALDAIVLFLNALSVIDNRMTPDSLIHRRLASDTRALNTIPFEMKIDVQIRSGDEVFLENMREQVKAAAEGAALAVGAKVKFEARDYPYERIIENKILEEVAKANVEYFGHKFTYDEPSPYPFGTDTGNLSHEFPTIQFLNGRPEGFKFHTPEGVEQSLSDSAHEMMLESSKILASTALDLLVHPEFIDSAKKELEGYRRSGFTDAYSWHQKT